MLIDIVKLKSNFVSSIEIEESIEVLKENLEGTDIDEIRNLKVDGFVDRDIMDEYHIQLHIEATLILKCAITLKPVEYPITIDVDGNYEDLMQEYGEKEKIITNSLDIWPIVWHNVLLVVPMKVVSPDAEYEKVKGEGWEVIQNTEE